MEIRVNKFAVVALIIILILVGIKMIFFKDDSSEENKVKNEIVNNVENTSNANEKIENTTTSTEAKEEKTLKVGNYTLKYGTYEGETYGDDGETSLMQIKINENNTFELDNTTFKFTVKEDGLYVSDYDFALIRVTGNNKFTYDVGGGVDLSFKEY